MDELELLGTLGQDTPGPDPIRRAQARALLLRRAEAPVGHTTIGWRAASWRLSRPRLAGVLLAGGVAAFLALTVVPFGAGTGDAAAATLDRISVVARGAADGQPAAGTFRHTVSDGVSAVGTSLDAAGTRVVWSAVPFQREVWIGAEGSGRLIEHRGPTGWFSPADEAAWVVAGSPAVEYASEVDIRFEPRSPGASPGVPELDPGSLAAADVEALPTDVDALEALIRERAAANGGGATPVEMFTIIGDLLGETVAPPDLRAALYQVLSGVDDVALMGTVADQAGRAGVGVAIEDVDPSPGGRGSQRYVLVIDPDTSDLLERQTVQLTPIEGLSAESPVAIRLTTYRTSELVPSMP